MGSSLQLSPIEFDPKTWFNYGQAEGCSYSLSILGGQTNVSAILTARSDARGTYNFLFRKG